MSRLGAPGTPETSKAHRVWVGDLDGDGEPDYLINWTAVPDHGAATDLYLSGLAKPGPPRGKLCRAGKRQRMQRKH